MFPESDPRLGEEWVHHKAGDSGFPTLDLDFVQLLVTELTTRAYETASATFPTVTADPGLLYAAGFSNGGGMVWQLLNSSLSAAFRGFAAVGMALDPEKARRYRCELASAGALPEPAPVAYIQGTADRGYRPTFTQLETALGLTLPAFTATEMLERNGIPTDAPATTQLVPGSAGVTEVVVQLFEGTEAFLMATVINGGHNWPTPTTHGNPPVADHFDATADDRRVLASARRTAVTAGRRGARAIVRGQGRSCRGCGAVPARDTPPVPRRGGRYGRSAHRGGQRR